MNHVDAANPMSRKGLGQLPDNGLDLGQFRHERRWLEGA